MDLIQLVSLFIINKCAALRTAILISIIIFISIILLYSEKKIKNVDSALLKIHRKIFFKIVRFETYSREIVSLCVHLVKVVQPPAGCPKNMGVF